MTQSFLLAVGLASTELLDLSATKVKIKIDVGASETCQGYHCFMLFKGGMKENEPTRLLSRF